MTKEQRGKPRVAHKLLIIYDINFISISPESSNLDRGMQKRFHLKILPTDRLLVTYYYSG